MLPSKSLSATLLGRYFCYLSRRHFMSAGTPRIWTESREGTLETQNTIWWHKIKFSFQETNCRTYSGHNTATENLLFENRDSVNIRLYALCNIVKVHRVTISSILSCNFIRTFSMYFLWRITKKNTAIVPGESASQADGIDYFECRPHYLFASSSSALSLSSS